MRGLIPVVLAAVVVSCAKAPPVAGPTPRAAAPRLVQGNVEPQAPFIIAADIPDTNNVTEYRLLLNEGAVETKPVTAVANARITFSVAGKPAGTYTYKIQAVNKTPEGEAYGSTDDLRVTVGIPVEQPSLAFPPQVTIVTPFTTQWVAPGGSSPKDWIGIFQAGTQFDVGWIYTNGLEQGSWTYAAPATAGPYEMKYCLNDGYTCPFIGPLAVIAGGAPVNCAGTWSEWACGEWTAVTATTEERTCSRSFTITTDPANGGTACPASPETKVETRPTTPPATGTVDVLHCVWQLTATPPTQAGGWKAQFQRGTTLTTAIGTPDSTAPYQRTASLEPGTYTFSVVWTKGGESAVTRAMGSKTCAVQEAVGRQ